MKETSNLKYCQLFFRFNFLPLRIILMMSLRNISLFWRMCTFICNRWNPVIPLQSQLWTKCHHQVFVDSSNKSLEICQKKPYGIKFWAFLFFFFFFWYFVEKSVGRVLIFHIQLKHVHKLSKTLFGRHQLSCKYNVCHKVSWVYPVHVGPQKLATPQWLALDCDWVLKEWE